MAEGSTADYFATIRSKGTLTPPPQDLSSVRCEDKGVIVSPETANQKQLAVSNSGSIPSEMWERQKLSHYLDTVFEDKKTCPPVIPIAAKFVDVKGKPHYIRATAWAFGTHYLFTCSHTFEDEKLIDPSTDDVVPVQLANIYWTDALTPTEVHGELELVYQDPDRDIAILKSEKAFHRLVLQSPQPMPYSRLYTIQILSVVHPIVHPGRAYPGPTMSRFLTDAISTEGFSGGPVMTANGHVIGMLQARYSDVNVVVASTESLLRAMRLLGGGILDWEQYGVKACIGWKIPPQIPISPTTSAARRRIDPVVTRFLRRKHDDWENTLGKIKTLRAAEEDPEWAAPL
ncbi:hypothetical protein ABW21_db0203973 [Orbilia brochopaga]|nr:hypothetical protein ABW21_db0203973 [Drechslerella brochopaga]